MSASKSHPDRRVRPDRPFVGRGLRDAWAYFSIELLVAIRQQYPMATLAMNQVLILVDTDGTTVADLARRAGMTKQAMAQAVANLETWNLVERVPHPGDGRARLVRLTDDGWQAVRVGFEVATGIERRWTDLLGVDRMHELARLLDELVDHLDAELPTV